jgi:hypothetical protein
MIDIHGVHVTVTRIYVIFMNFTPIFVIESLNAHRMAIYVCSRSAGAGRAAILNATLMA